VIDVSFDNGIIDAASHLSVMTSVHEFAVPVSKIDRPLYPH